MEDLKIGERIQGLLREKCTTQKELAAAVGVHPNVVSYWCNGSRTPNAEQIVSIAREFGVTTDYVLGFSDVETPNQDVQAVCHVMGLSESSAENLIKLMKTKGSDDDPEGYDIERGAEAIDCLLSSWDCLESLATNIRFVIDDCEQAQDYLNAKRFPDSWYAKALEVGKITDRMELSFFRADQAFQRVIDKLTDYRKILEELYKI